MYLIYTADHQMALFADIDCARAEQKARNNTGRMTWYIVEVPVNYKAEFNADDIQNGRVINKPKFSTGA